MPPIWIQIFRRNTLPVTRVFDGCASFVNRAVFVLAAHPFRCFSELVEKWRQVVNIEILNVIRETETDQHAKGIVSIKTCVSYFFGSFSNAENIAYFPHLACYGNIRPLPLCRCPRHLLIIPILQQLHHMFWNALFLQKLGTLMANVRDFSSSLPF